MNFRIIEGDYSLYDKAEAFAKYYNNQNYTAEDICKILEISYNNYRSLSKYCFEEGLIPVLRKGGRLKPKYYTFNRNSRKFHVMKTKVYYGCFKTEDEAKKFVELMKDCCWDKSKVEYVKELMCKS